MKTLKLLRDLKKILRLHIKDHILLRIVLEDIVLKFTKESYLKYSLSNDSYLILSKDVRGPSWKRRYPDSPFPLLSSVETYKNSIGSWNEELKLYGLKSRLKLHDQPSADLPDIGTHIYLSYIHNINSKSNKYLRYQYKLLRKYRSLNQVTRYWKLCWYLMQHSWSYRIASLNSWKPRWYKELGYLELQQIFRVLHTILSLKTLKTQITNVWIESPKGKWRQLCIPPKGWRLYLHMLNQFISYIHEPRLSKSVYHGFIYNRGCKSWWEDLIWSDRLHSFPYLMEVDLSSGFPNCSHHYLQRSLKESGLYPLPILNLILQHVRSPLLRNTTFPTFKTYVEDRMNEVWRTGNRSVPMGMGISPILFVIFLSHQLRVHRLWNSEFHYMFYADDGSFFFTWRGLQTYLQHRQLSILDLLNSILTNPNGLVSILNSDEELSSSGIKFCSEKSRLIKLSDLWLQPLSSLGLQLYLTPSSWIQYIEKFLDLEFFNLELQLKGNTRGRGANPLTGKAGTKGSQTRLIDLGKLSTVCLDYPTLKEKLRQYFGLIQNQLYASESLSPLPFPSRWGKIKAGSILQNLFRHKSILSEVLKFDPYTIGSQLNKLLLEINSGTKLEPTQLPLDRELTIPWTNLKSPILEQTIPDDLQGKSVQSNDYFTKFSELNLSYTQLGKLKEEYELLQKSLNPKN